jgi:hypothetical protein
MTDEEFESLCGTLWWKMSNRHPKEADCDCCLSDDEVDTINTIITHSRELRARLRILESTNKELS